VLAQVVIEGRDVAQKAPQSRTLPLLLQPLPPDVSS
jgi:hypothetical protein